MTAHNRLTHISVPSGRDTCDGWHFPANSDELTSPAGRPIVVMAHGLGGTKDSGLRPFAEALAAGGFDVLAFDYRGFGASSGAPRQTVSMTRQVEDYRAAMQAAALVPGVDPQRLVLWGVSLSGGHVFEVAAGRDDVVAVVSLTPLVDGLAAGRHALSSHRPVELARTTATGVRARVSSRLRREPVMMPLVGHPGEPAALTLDGCYEDYLALAGPTWRNEIDAAVVLEMGGYRPSRKADQLRCPMLVQIADFDRSAPPAAAAKAAFNARAEVRHYDGDHFDVWPGKDCFAAVVEHQLAFLTRHLGPTT